MFRGFVDPKRLGKEATPLRYTGEGNVLSGNANQIDLGDRMLAWFAKYLSP